VQLVTQMDASDFTWRRRRIAVLTGISAIVAVILVALIVSFVTRDTRRDLTLAEVVKSAARSEGDVSGILGDLRDRTEELCAQLPGCIEGYHSPELDLLRFSSKDDAEAFAAAKVERHRSGWIVIEYDGDEVPIEQRNQAEAFIDGLWTSE
jgi:hypothetical protein